MRFAATNGSYGRTAARRVICVAAFGSLSSCPSSWAFMSQPLPRHSVPPYFAARHPSKHTNAIPTMAQLRQSRPLFTKKDDNDWETFKEAGQNLVKRGVDKIKSFIPFLKSDDGKRSEMIKKERKGEITGGINAMLRDMPLPIRMLGRAVAPLMASAAEQLAEQSRQAEDMLEEARVRILNDPIVIENLGVPIQVGDPFSQSSSAISINGQTTATVTASFPVAGPRGNGIARMESSNGEIRSLTVNVNGRNLSVGSKRGGGSAYGKSSSVKDDNIIEAEIIEKKY
ncbi:hypothetical protein ACHAXA_008229 [Cyclostephanos tholiformis]|uniref:Uncharacterized protein n=1 Tax=Cyclostephanos tholiformis TaxID=382380 RepID=A0ABD3R6M6_9STRA